MAEGYQPQRERPPLVTIVAIGNLIMALLCTCPHGYWMVTPLMMEGFKTAAQSFEREKDKQIAQLLRQRQAAKTLQEKQQIDAAIAAMKAFNMSRMIEPFTTPQVKAFFFGIGLLRVLLNVLLFISGIGLLVMAGWARALAIVASVVHLGAALVSAVYNLVVFVPAMARVGQEWMAMVSKMAAPAGAPPMPAPNWGMFTGISVASTLFWLLIDGAWFVFVLIVLLLPDVRRAFQA